MNIWQQYYLHILLAVHFASQVMKASASGASAAAAYKVHLSFISSSKLYIAGVMTQKTQCCKHHSHVRYTLTLFEWQTSRCQQLLQLQFDQLH
jgi:hypothetical protein